MTPDAHASLLSSGTIILDSRKGFATALLDMETGAKTVISHPGQNLRDLVVSPDRKRFAFERATLDESGRPTGEGSLVVASTDGTDLRVLPWEDGWIWIARWLDNHNLIINIAGQDPQESTAAKPASLLVLNPETGERKMLEARYPDIYDMPPIPDWAGEGITTYDPALTRVVYLRSDSSGGYSYALWDLDEERLLQTLISPDLTREPVWSPDGAQFVVPANRGDEWLTFELYSVDRDGLQVTRLTDLGSVYGPVYIQSLSWSPDGAYIAFWVNPDPASGQDFGAQHLAILDTTSGLVTDYCIAGDLATSRGSLIPPPLWSPDGRQLIVEELSLSRASRVILVDLASREAGVIAEGFTPAGWMSTDP